MNVFGFSNPSFPVGHRIYLTYSQSLLSIYVYSLNLRRITVYM